MMWAWILWFAKFHWASNFSDNFNHSSWVFGVARYFGPIASYSAWHASMTSFKIVTLLIRNWNSGERNNSPVTKYLITKQHISAGFIHSLIIASFLWSLSEGQSTILLKCSKSDPFSYSSQMPVCLAQPSQGVADENNRSYFFLISMIVPNIVFFLSSFHPPLPPLTKASQVLKPSFDDAMMGNLSKLVSSRILWSQWWRTESTVWQKP